MVGGNRTAVRLVRACRAQLALKPLGRGGRRHGFTSWVERITRSDIIVFCFTLGDPANSVRTPRTVAPGSKPCRVNPKTLKLVLTAKIVLLYISLSFLLVISFFFLDILLCIWQEQLQGTKYTKWSGVEESHISSCNSGHCGIFGKVFQRAGESSRAVCDFWFWNYRNRELQ